MTKPNRTKIIATLGPASRSEETIRQLIAAGADVFRLNAAHGDGASLVRDIRLVRRVGRRMKAGVGILVDLQGPKIRVGVFDNADPIWLRRGQEIIVSCAPGVVGRAAPEGEVTRIGCRYEGLARDVRRGERVLLDDGNIELRVLGVEGTEIRAKVVYGGLLKQLKGINLPGSKVGMPCLTEKDLVDLGKVLEQDVDFIALSFVRSRGDVRELKERIAAQGSDALVIAKIERPEAVSDLAEILAEADGLMIARGDMGVELGPDRVPSLQKRIIRASVAACKPVITATQMLESMVVSPRPTRAEASDVANAIYDHTSAVMLSAETASGKYPVRAVKMMDRIVRRTEVDMFERYEYTRRRRRRPVGSSVTTATVRAAAYAAIEAEASVIAVFTESGQTAQLLSSESTPTRIVAFTPFQRTVQRLSLTWGVTARRVLRTRTSHEMTLEGERMLLRDGLAKPGSRVVVVVGSSRQKGLTNVMNIRVLGES